MKMSIILSLKASFKHFGPMSEQQTPVSHNNDNNTVADLFNKLFSSFEKGKKKKKITCITVGHIGNSSKYKINNKFILLPRKAEMIYRNASIATLTGLDAKTRPTALLIN